MHYGKISAGRRTGLGKCAVSLTLCAALFAGTTAGAVNTTAGTASSCTCGCAACSGASISDIAESSLPFVVSITNISVQEGAVDKPYPIFKLRDKIEEKTGWDGYADTDRR